MQHSIKGIRPTEVSLTKGRFVLAWPELGSVGLVGSFNSQGQLHSFLGSQKVGFELDAGGCLAGAMWRAGGLGMQALLVALDRSLQTSLEVW